MPIILYEVPPAIATRLHRIAAKSLQQQRALFLLLILQMIVYNYILYPRVHLLNTETVFIRMIL